MKVLKGLEILGIQKLNPLSKSQGNQTSFLFGNLLSSFMFSRSKNSRFEFNPQMAKGTSDRGEPFKQTKNALTSKSSAEKNLNQMLQSEMVTGSERRKSKSQLSESSKKTILNTIMSLMNPGQNQTAMTANKSEITAIKVQMQKGKQIINIQASNPAAQKKIEQFLEHVQQKVKPHNIELPKIVVHNMLKPEAATKNTNNIGPENTAHTEQTSSVKTKNTQGLKPSKDNIKMKVNQGSNQQTGPLSKHKIADNNTSITAANKATPEQTSAGKLNSSVVIPRQTNHKIAEEQQFSSKASAPDVKNETKEIAQRQNNSAKHNQEPKITSSDQELYRQSAHGLDKTLAAKTEIPEKQNRSGRGIGRKSVKQDVPELKHNRSSQPDPKENVHKVQLSTEAKADGPTYSLIKQAKKSAQKGNKKPNAIRVESESEISSAKIISHRSQTSSAATDQTETQRTSASKQEPGVHSKAKNLRSVQLSDNPPEVQKAELRTQGPDAKVKAGTELKTQIIREIQLPNPGQTDLSPRKLDTKSKIIARKVNKGTIVTEKGVQPNENAQQKVENTNHNRHLHAGKESSDRIKQGTKSHSESIRQSNDLKVDKSESIPLSNQTQAEIKIADQNQKLVQLGSRIQEIIEKLNAKPVQQNKLNTSFKIAHSPAGELEIVVHEQSKLKKLKIIVKSEAARQDLQKVLPQVQQNLMTKGIEFASFSVDVANVNNKNGSANSNSKNADRSKHKQNEEVQNEHEESALGHRKYGYNTMEIVA